MKVDCLFLLLLVGSASFNIQPKIKNCQEWRDGVCIKKDKANLCRCSARGLRWVGLRHGRRRRRRRSNQATSSFLRRLNCFIYLQTCVKFLIHNGTLDTILINNVKDNVIFLTLKSL